MMDTPSYAVLFVEGISPVRISELSETVQRHSGSLCYLSDGRPVVLTSRIESMASLVTDLLQQPHFQQIRAGASFGHVVLNQALASGPAIDQAIYLATLAKPGAIICVRPIVDPLKLVLETTSCGSHLIPGFTSPIDVFDCSVSNSAPDDMHPSSDLDRRSSVPEFDFSRVDQERLQEEEALVRSISTQSNLEAPLELADRHSTQSSSLTPAERPVSTPPPSSVSHIRKGLQKAAWVFSIFVIGIPVIIMGALFTLVEIDKRAEADMQQAVSEKLEESLILKTFQNTSPTPETAADSEPSSIKRAQSKLKPGILTIRTRPAGANVYINNARMTQSTPVRIGNVPPNDPVQLRVEMPGYESQIQIINISSAEHRELDIHLSPIR